MHHHQSDVVLRSLSLVDENQLLRLERYNLADKLTAYAACRAGYHYPAVLQTGGYCRHVNLYLVAWQ